MAILSCAKVYLLAFIYYVLPDLATLDSPGRELGQLEGRMVLVGLHALHALLLLLPESEPPPDDAGDLRVDLAAVSEGGGHGLQGDVVVGGAHAAGGQHGAEGGGQAADLGGGGEEERRGEAEEKTVSRTRVAT